MIDIIIIAIVVYLAGGSLHAFLKKTFGAFRPQTHNIVMLGPRGVGKTSVLAGIAHAYDKIARDLANKEWEELKELRLGQNSATKQKISRTIADLEATAEMVRKEACPAQGIQPHIKGDVYASEYTFYLSSSDVDPNVAKTVTLNFHDYPGEWTLPNHVDRPKAVEKLKNAQIVIIAIDAPYLFEQEGRYNNSRNASTDVLNMLRDADAFSSGQGVLLLVPNRCEKYLQDPQMKKRIPTIVEERYSSLISHFTQAKYKNRLRIAICPVQTVGCIKFDSFSTTRFYDPPDGTPAPIFWPSHETPSVARYDPKFLTQIVFHVVIHALEQAAAQDSKASKKFESALPKITKELMRTDGFKIVQPGKEGGNAYA